MSGGLQSAALALQTDRSFKKMSELVLADRDYIWTEILQMIRYTKTALLSQNVRICTWSHSSSSRDEIFLMGLYSLS